MAEDTNAISGQGASLEQDGQKVGQVTSLSGPNMSRSTIDATHLESPDGYNEFIGGLRDGGDVTFTMHYNKADYDALKTAFENDSPKSYTLKLDDSQGTQISFKGLVTELPLNIPVNDRMTSDVTVKVANKPTVSTA